MADEKQFYFHGEIKWEWGVDNGPEAGENRFEPKSDGTLPINYNSMPYETSVMLQKAAVFAPIRAGVEGLEGLANATLESGAYAPDNAKSVGNGKTK